MHVCGKQKKKQTKQSQCAYNMTLSCYVNFLSKTCIGSDHLESTILKITGKKIDNPSCHQQSIFGNNR